MPAMVNGVGRHPEQANAVLWEGTRLDEACGVFGALRHLSHALMLYS